MKLFTSALAVVVLGTIAVFSVEENASILSEEPPSTSVHASAVPTVIAAEKIACLLPQGAHPFPRRQSQIPMSLSQLSADNPLRQCVRLFGQFNQEKNNA